MTHGRIHALSLLSTKILNSCSIYDGQVGDFQVATGGGFWVAIRVNERFLKVKKDGGKLGRLEVDL